jgi:hypothetical protein
MTMCQSKSGELFNNFVSGAIGGAVGTMINTPCKPSRPLSSLPVLLVADRVYIIFADSDSYDVRGN